jgi:nucleoside-diphosphate-sugar epimerase
MSNILITGITGFLGSHIAEELSHSGINVIGLKRVNSDTWRCADFEEKITWLNLDGEDNWKEKINELKPEVIIHSAWIGVEAKYRDDWKKQAENINFLVELLDVSKQINLRQFVFLGSQAEYGFFEGKITEDEPVMASNAYGSIKLASLEILRTFSEINSINWIWLRLFSLFGEKEGENWLIPSVIKKMMNDDGMDFTFGEQKYAYMYVKDFSKIIHSILIKSIHSGIYNVSSNQPIQLKSLIETLGAKINPSFKLNFGSIPYRQHQSMHIEGDTSKLTKEIGLTEFTDFNAALQNTIQYYITY